MRLIYINGCTKGLGLEISKLLVNDEDNLICIVRDKNKLGDLSAIKHHITIYKCDYSSLIDAKNTGNGLFSYHDYSLYNEIYFINNISVIDPVNKIGCIDDDGIIKSFTINIISNFIVINNFLKSLSNCYSPVYLLNISSGISTNPVPGLFMYGLAKSYLDYLNKQVVREYANNNINLKTTSFYPGGMNTKMQSHLRDELKKIELSEFNYEKIYNQRIMSTKQIANIIVDIYFQNNIGWEKYCSSVNDYL